MSGDLADELREPCQLQCQALLDCRKSCAAKKRRIAELQERIETLEDENAVLRIISEDAT